MARSTRAAAAAAKTGIKTASITPDANSGKAKSETGKSAGKSKAVPRVKHEDGDKTVKVKHEDITDDSSRKSTAKTSKRTASSNDDTRRVSKRVKVEDSPKKTGLPSPSPSPEDLESLGSDDESADYKPGSKSVTSKTKKPSTPASKSKSQKATKSTPTKDLSTKKLQAYFKNANQSPFPDFAHPTAEEAKLAHKILSSLHGARTRPTEVVASKSRAGCGDSPSVLDALVRTILSQNTSDTNSTRAKRSMDTVYGSSDNWTSIVSGGQAKLESAIRCGGLSVTKSKVILSILEQTHSKYGSYSLDHLHKSSNEDAMREMLAFQGVGPKTASCVLLFCLQRESFAVDTHVHRITGLLGWRPKTANRDETHAHLDARIPDEDKYGLHILLVKHGKVCDECKAGGKNVGKCELRRAFRKGKVDGEVGEELKAEEEEVVKKEEEDDEE